MQFSVNFVGNNAVNSNKVQNYLGTDDIERIKQELEMPDLDLSLVKEYFTPCVRDPNIKITYNTALKSGKFKNDKSYTVKVSPHFLNIFLYKKTHIQKNKNNGAIERIYMSFQLNEAGVIQLWEHLGFPDELES